MGELNKQHEIVRLLTTTLRKCLSNMASFSPSGKVESTTLYDDRYTKGELVEYHLDLLKFLLKEGDLYLSWVRCEELWETLVANPQRYVFLYLGAHRSPTTVLFLFQLGV